MSLAAETRAAVRARPAVYEALRAGIVNYTAAADALDVDGDREAIATALRRFAADLDEEEPADSANRSITVRLHSDIEGVDASALLAVDGAGIDHPGEGVDGVDTDGRTAVHVTGEVDAELLAESLARLRIVGVGVDAAGVVDGAMVVVVARRDGPQVVQVVESVAESGV